MLEQQLRIVIYFQLHPDLRQQPHPFDVIAVPQQELTDELLGGDDLAVRKETRGGNHLHGQGGEFSNVLAGDIGVRGAPGYLEQDLQGVPARRQRRIDVHRPQKRLDGGFGLLPRDVAMAALLKQPAEVRMQLLEPGERPQSIGYALQISLADGDDVPDVAILRNLLAQRLGIGQRCRELAFLQEGLQAQHLRFDSGGRTIRHLIHWPSPPPRCVFFALIPSRTMHGARRFVKLRPYRAGSGTVASRISIRLCANQMRVWGRGP